MTTSEALHQLQQPCDDLHVLALEENRFLQQRQCAPDAALLDRKRALLARLEAALTALRSVAPGSARADVRPEVLDRARDRILQILQLDRENEQLLLRFSLTGSRLAPAAPAAAVAPALLRDLYGRLA